MMGLLRTTSNTKPTPASRSDPTAAKSRRDLIAAALGGSEGTSNITNNTITPPPKPVTAAPGAAAGMLSKILPP